MSVHYRAERIQKGTFHRVEHPLCLCGNAHEQNSLTRNPAQVTCPRCMEIITVAKERCVEPRLVASEVIQGREIKP